MEDNFVKITNATYKVLDFFPNNDPLKNKAKEKVLAILENLTLISSTHGWMSLKTCLLTGREKASAQLINDIEILETYLKLGKEQGWIGGVNFLILIKEYSRIKNQISSTKRSTEIISNFQFPISNKMLNDKKEKIEIKNNETKKLDDYSDRQRKILQILSEKEKVQVVDIIKEIPNITKRTIRRDLDDLLKKGEIIRIGEFNQSFYTISLVNQRNSQNYAEQTHNNADTVKL